MTSISSDTWNRLTRPSGERLVARPALPDLTHRLLCALDSGGNRHLLVALQPANSDLVDLKSRGVAVNTRDLVIQGQPPNRYVDIECLDPTGYSVLDLMGGELAEELRDENKEPADIIRGALAKWRRFWGQLPQQLLSREEQLGLFAELWFVSVWLLPRLGPPAVLAWRGPWGSRHDFEWSDKSVEVKAATHSRGRIHRINGIDQLEPPSNGPLYLFSLLLREEAGSMLHLPALIESCSTQLSGFDEALSHLESGLIQLGYSPTYKEEYSKLHLRVLDAALFYVNGDFPRITATSFSNGIPPGVERVEYQINLATFNNLIIAHEPQELPFE